MYRVLFAIFSISVSLAITGCSKEAAPGLVAPIAVIPEIEVGETGEVGLEEPQNVVEAEGSVPAEETRKFLGFLRKKNSDPAFEMPTTTEDESHAEDVPPPADVHPQQLITFAMADEEIEAAAPPLADEIEEEPRRGLLGFLRKKKPESAPEDSGQETLSTTISAPNSDLNVLPNRNSDSEQDAALPEPEIEPITMPEPAPEKRLRGPRWLGGGRRNGAPVAPEQPSFDRPLGVIPFGQVVPNCEVKKRDLGKHIAKAQGTAKYRLYDTDPSSIIPRTHYISGFGDGCVRQLTASLVLFGSPVVHETKRYDANNTAPYSPLDLEYEKAKRKICGVRRGKPCPSSRIDRLGREIAFVSIYKEFGDSGGWIELLLLKGDIASMETRFP